jgi:hypothetical protein
VRTLIHRAWSSPAVWRMVDAYAPRVFGLVIHTALVVRYGAKAYALPTWCLGVLGIALSLIPDPHVLILIRRSGQAARRLLALTTPWVLAKLLLGSTACWVSLALFSGEAIVEPHGNRALVVTASALLYGAVEAAWGVLGTTALAMGNLRKVAIGGLAARTVSLLLMAAGFAVGAPYMGFDFMLVALPPLVVLVWLLPFTVHMSRNVALMWFATSRYGIWQQGVTILANLLLQAPVLVLGAWPLVSAAVVGQVSYLTRVLGAVLQPIQILQSLVIREVALTRGKPNTRLDRLRIVFRASAIIVGAVGGVCILLAHRKGVLERDAALLSGWLVAGVAFSCWYRFEFSRVLATLRIRELFLFGYAPVCLVAVMIGAGLIPMLGNLGLGIAVSVGWFGTSLSWRWIQRFS